jgi:hypothetical protein
MVFSYYTAYVNTSFRACPFCSLTHGIYAGDFFTLRKSVALTLVSRATPQCGTRRSTVLGVVVGSSLAWTRRRSGPLGFIECFILV